MSIASPQSVTVHVNGFELEKVKLVLVVPARTAKAPVTLAVVFGLTGLVSGIRQRAVVAFGKKPGYAPPPEATVMVSPGLNQRPYASFIESEPQFVTPVAIAYSSACSGSSSDFCHVSLSRIAPSSFEIMQETKCVFASCS